MPSVEELLSVAESNTDTRSTSDNRIEIDADTRIIRMMPQDELFGVESDEKSERKYFKVPKIVGNGVDLSKLQLRINYQNASKISSGKDMYIVTDATVYNDEWVYFSWELSRKVTQYKGNIYFIVCAVKADSNGNITNEWNTTLAEGKVLEGLEVETSQEQQYQASDYLKQLKQQLLDYSKEIKDTFPSDYTQMQNDIGSLKADLDELDSRLSESITDFTNVFDYGYQYVDATKIIDGSLYYANGKVWDNNADYKRYPYVRLKSNTKYYVVGADMNFTGIKYEDGTTILVKNIPTYDANTKSFVLDSVGDIFISASSNSTIKLYEKDVASDDITGYYNVSPKGMSRTYKPNLHLNKGWILANGNDQNIEGYVHSDFIPVSKGDVVTWSGYHIGSGVCGVAFYDRFGRFVKNITPSNALAYGAINGIRIGIDNDGYIKAMSRVSVIPLDLSIDTFTEHEKEQERMNYSYVSPNGSDATGDGTSENPFATIFHANEVINNARAWNKWTIKVADGTYTDLQEKYKGVQGTGEQGVRTKNWVFYEGNIERPDMVVIQWDSTIGFDTVTSETGVNNCPFHISAGEVGYFSMERFGMHTSIKGFTFDCTHGRYSLHIESNSYNLGREWSVENCIFKYHGDGKACVGMGTGWAEKGLFRNCQFFNDLGTLAIQTHDNNLISEYGFEPYMVIGFDYLFENCNFNGMGLELRSIKDISYDVPNVVAIKNVKDCGKIRVGLRNAVDDKPFTIVQLGTDYEVVISQI